MRANYNRTGAARKEMVKVIEKITGQKAKYMFMPTCNFVIGDFTVTKDGGLECEDVDALERLVRGLIAEGIEPEEMPEGTAEEPAETPQEGAQGEPDRLSIELPADTLDDEAYLRLLKITQAKENLIKKALGAENIPVIRTEEKLIFPWFSQTDADSVNAYMVFVTRLCDFAKNAKRVTAKEKEVENEKYAFRCFLLRLGMIGEEYKGCRKLLMKNLTGSAAWKNGGAGHDISE